uniref:Uncharacterized protein n=1 Tax=Loxodonta africana TaxID=9785 RepID=G3UKZ6_LOXAF
SPKFCCRTRLPSLGPSPIYVLAFYWPKMTRRGSEVPHKQTFISDR